MPKNVESLQVSEYQECKLAVALESGQWHALISLDGQRLEDLPSGFSSVESARLACYLGLKTFLSFERRVLPDFDQLRWDVQSDLKGWLERFYAKAVWPEEAKKVARTTES